MLHSPEQGCRVVVHLDQSICGFPKFQAHLPSFLGHFQKSVGGLPKSLGHLTKSFWHANANVSPLPRGVAHVLQALVDGRTIPAFVTQGLVEAYHTPSGVLPIFRHLRAMFCQVPPAFSQVHKAFIEAHA
ncbi:MAG: hypothetical protein HYZ44_05695 [Bacteroidetes bacterium]|nr:hypothetical protein [Bacteroidota bacterium]